MSRFSQWATSSVGGRFSVIGAWLVIALIAAPFAFHVSDALDGSARLAGSESARVEAALQQRFKSQFAKIALLRIAAGPGAATADGHALLKQVTDALLAVTDVQGVLSYLDRGDALFIGQDGSSIVILGVSSAAGMGDRLMLDLRRATDAVQSQVKQTYPKISFSWTGENAVNSDVRRLSAAETHTAELLALPLTLLLLIAAFRSLVAAMLPIVCGALTIIVSLGIVGALNRQWPASIIVVSIISMVGLGLSIDYALLIVSRYRDAMASGLSRPAAAADAAAYGGHTVVVSGSAVAIGFAAMLLVPVSEVRSIGVGGLIVTTTAALIASTLLPRLLSVLAAGVDAGRLGPRPIPRRTERWRLWALWVSEHPVRVLLIGGLPLVLLASQAYQLRTDLPRGRWLPESAESVRVLHEIDAVANGNFGQMIEVILELPSGTVIQDEAGWRGTAKAVRHFAHDARVQHVWAVTNVTVAPLGGPEILRRIPESVRGNFIAADGKAVLIQLLPKQGLAAADAARLVRQIRAEDASALTGLVGAHLSVGGLPAFNVDYEDAIRHSLGLIVLIVIGATLLVLSFAFRSVLIPLKAVALNLTSVAAAFGAVTIVFQDGVGSRLLGLPRPMDGGFPLLPVLVFCIVFGLSMDYEVFIVASIADGRRAGLSDRLALIEGITRTGRVITYAAAIMVLIFAAFILGEFVLIKFLGFALGVAVLLDATLIRLAVGPALMQLAGRWNWWPGDRHKAVRSP